MRSFDPIRVGELECDSWVAYYQHRWLTFLRAALGLTREAFGLSPWQTLRGSWWVLRANQAWAPPTPDNDPEAARRYMERFYRMVAEKGEERFDPAEAARLEIDWWRAHRELRENREEGEDGPLVEAFVRLYSHIYSVPPDSVRTAAEQRSRATLHSDRWVAQGCPDDSPLITEERAALIRCYEALLEAVRR
jgi:hypothetical protein